MVWTLKSENGVNNFYLYKNQEYIISRKTGEIIIENDPSISRKHAIIKLNSVSVLDCGSKYGTSVNMLKLSQNSEIILKENDVIKFGVYNSKFKFNKFNIITTSSCLEDAQKKLFKSKIRELNGSVISTWNDNCTHLTANEIMLTIKVLSAIIDNKPIVTLEFWNQFERNISVKKPPPNVEDFKPPVTETLLDTFNMTANLDRTNLFKEKVFVFSTEKSRSKISDLIGKTGGSTTSWETELIVLSQVKNSPNKYLFILDEKTVYPANTNQNEIFDYLEKNGERLIPIQEIATAILYSSCEKDCNPRLNSLNVFNNAPFVVKTEGYSLVQETMEDDFKQPLIESKSDIIIPQSLDAEIDFVIPKKRQMDSNTEHAPKRSKNQINEIMTKRVDFPSTSKTQSNLESFMSLEKQTISKDSGNTFSSSANKRKAEDCIFQEKSKEQKLNQNVSPFYRTKLKIETIDDENPFLEIINQSERQAEIAPVPTPIKTKVEISASVLIGNYVPSDSSNVQWISTRNGTASFSNETNIDPEFQEIYDRFKDSVVIEILPKDAIKMSKVVKESTSDKIERKRNFKKFKKVYPLRPQTTILSTSVYNESPTSPRSPEQIIDEQPISICKPAATEMSSVFQF